jgi:anti-sigma regulatory factor (Ser/Thr protein kinase)
VREDGCVVVHDALRLDLQGSPASVAEARRFVAQALQAWHLDEVVDTALLLTSELATNAVLHARSTFAVLVARQGDKIRVDVLDSSPVPPLRRNNSLTAATGRGVGLVAALASEWGHTPSERLDGFVKGVWFTLPVSGVAPPEIDWFADL